MKSIINTEDEGEILVTVILDVYYTCIMLTWYTFYSWHSICSNWINIEIVNLFAFKTVRDMIYWYYASDLELHNSRSGRTTSKIHELGKKCPLHELDSGKCYSIHELRHSQHENVHVTYKIIQNLNICMYLEKNKIIITIRLSFYVFRIGRVIRAHRF